MLTVRQGKERKFQIIRIAFEYYHFHETFITISFDPGVNSSLLKRVHMFSAPGNSRERPMTEAPVGTPIIGFLANHGHLMRAPKDCQSTEFDSHKRYTVRPESENVVGEHRISRPHFKDFQNIHSIGF